MLLLQAKGLGQNSPTILSYLDVFFFRSFVQFCIDRIQLSASYTIHTDVLVDLVFISQWMFFKISVQITVHNCVHIIFVALVHLLLQRYSTEPFRGQGTTDKPNLGLLFIWLSFIHEKFNGWIREIIYYSPYIWNLQLKWIVIYEPITVHVACHFHIFQFQQVEPDLQQTNIFSSLNS